MAHIPLWVEEQFSPTRYWEHPMLGIDLPEVEKLLDEARQGIETAQKALSAIQPTIDRLDDLVPDIGYGVYLHMVRVAVDQFSTIEGKK